MVAQEQRGEAELSPELDLLRELRRTGKVFTGTCMREKVAHCETGTGTWSPRTWKRYWVLSSSWSLLVGLYRGLETSGEGQGEEDLPWWRGVRPGTTWTWCPRSVGPGRVRPAAWRSCKAARVPLRGRGDQGRFLQKRGTPVSRRMGGAAGWWGASSWDLGGGSAASDGVEGGKMSFLGRGILGKS